MSKILITGGTGYVGGRITGYLIKHTDHDLYISSRQPVKLPDILSNTGRVHAVSSDEVFSDASSFDYPVDTVIHLAALNEIDCALHPLKAIEVNIGKSVQLLQKAIRSKTKRFIYFSTAHVYGAPLTGNISELTLARPSHPYAITHKAVEDFVYAAHETKQIEGISLRLSNSIGAPLSPAVNRWTLLVNDLCRQAVTEKKLTLLSAGKQQRDFIALEDVCRCALHFLNIDTDRLGDGIYNLGGNCVMSVLEMAKLIQLSCQPVLSYTPELIVPANPASPGILEELYFDTTKLSKSGFKLEGSIKNEIERLLFFCAKHFGK